MKLFLPVALLLVVLRAVAAPPDLPREFRAAWVATVYNLDWPSRAGMSAASQQEELTDILDRMSAAGMNAVILQVRPAADALYDSRFEPWSPVLTGSMGVAPGYDPLEFAVDQAHRRGMELHAWFNPFRAQTNYRNRVSSDHVTKRKAEWVRRYGNYLWLDPGVPAVREYSIRVILDVVSRYDIDGVHIDDYFYPYPVPGNARPDPFPDGSTFRRHGSGDVADWRRSNIDRFVEDLYRAIKSEKSWVKLGISPFGIWRPGVPAGTTAGLDAYGQLYGDSRKWLQSGWCDYFTPQLYWTIGSSGQSFAILLDWWVAENGKRRHLWPGIAVDRIGKDRDAREILRQIELQRRAGGTTDGHVLWSVGAFAGDRGGVRRVLEDAAYSTPALVPGSPWLDRRVPGSPRIRASVHEGKVVGELDGVDSDVRFFVLQTRRGGEWESEVLDGRMRRFRIDLADEVAVTPVDRAGNAGKPARISF